MQITREKTLLCDAIRFYSKKDEDILFEWIDSINCIENVSATGRGLYLHINTETIDDQSLKELIGLFYRYDINMKQLAQFLTEGNKKWFYDDKKAFWHKKVFGK